MSRIFSLLFIFIFTLGIFSCGNKTEAPDYTAQLTQLNNLYDSALLTRDTTTLKKLYGEKFMLTNPDGQLLNKQQQLLSVATSEVKWDNAKSDNVTIQFYGNTAVLFGEFRGTGSYRGNPLTIHERYTTFWIKTDTSWQLMAEHANIVR